MTNARYGWVQRQVQRLASTAWGAALVAPVLHHGDAAVARLSGGRWTLTAALTGLPVRFVTTTGARTGVARTLPLVCVRLSGDAAEFALIGTNFGRARTPGWFYNLRAHPRALVRVGPVWAPHWAREAGGVEYERYWQAAVQTYAGYGAYRARVHGRPIPIMVLSPAQPDD